MQAQGYSWDLVLVRLNIVAPFTGRQDFWTSLQIGADEERPIRREHEEISKGIESDGQVERKEGIVRRRLVPVFEGKRNPSSNASGLWSRQRFTLFVGICSLVPHLILIAPCFLATESFSADPASTAIAATGHQLVSFCRSVCDKNHSYLILLRAVSIFPYSLHSTEVEMNKVSVMLRDLNEFL